MSLIEILDRLKETFIARLIVTAIYLLTAAITDGIHIFLSVFIKPLNKRIYLKIKRYNDWTFMARK